MTSKFLPVFAKNALLEAHQALPGLIDGSAKEADVLAVCGHFRRRGLCELLFEGAPERLHRFLFMSGCAYLHFLERAVPAARHVSKAAPFFDALASMDLQRARRIALASTAPFNPKREYEEDFLYVQRLMGMVAQRTEPAEVRARHAALCMETDDARWHLVEALLHDDTARLNDALTRMLREEASRWRRLHEEGAVREEEAATEMHVCIEGLALAWLAQQRGLGTLSDYPQVPSLARIVPDERPAAELWMDPMRW
ncbi:Imm49 family immunity protein [Myxococcus sp. AM010]|uniref:Imm49 family immunity protein n=1 Tax=Myxococcus sp. AM010 TaxID=2745138 RepID=UPI0015956C7D|nr:immunity 49 family protein [Myxococcus sp. AM010]